MNMECLLDYARLFLVRLVPVSLPSRCQSQAHVVNFFPKFQFSH